jgi:peptidoglycan hydrolase-like protein with peptidoglycan-binding domain
MQTIKQGSKGNDVKQWQTVIGVTVDGQFGSGTATATKAWQKAHGLTADGIVGNATWNAALLSNVVNTVANPSIVQAPVLANTEENFPPVPVTSTPVSKPKPSLFAQSQQTAEAVESPSFQIPSGAIQIPGVGNLAVENAIDLEAAKKKKQQQQMIYIGGGIVGVSLLAYMIFKSAEKKKYTNKAKHYEKLWSGMKAPRSANRDPFH